MWPFCRRRIQRPSSMLRRMVAGLIIGGAVGSIIGRKLIEKAHRDHHDDIPEEDGGE